MFAGAYRMNAAQKPFDDPAIRRVLWKLVDQREVLDGLGLDAKYATTCSAFFMCGGPYESKAGTEVAALRLRPPAPPSRRRNMRASR
jgi:peptide/nickel transport system substrate-binding protein